VKRVPKGTIARWLRQVALACESDDCLLFPFGKDPHGYGIATINGRCVRANRFICEAAHGSAPTTEHQAAHRCGVTACVNPRHLRWATPSENQLDRIGHDTHIRGERHPSNKLTRIQVLAIRTAPGKPRDLAADYGVTPGMIRHIKKGRAWKWL
jgi:hypothetical protein